MATRSFIRFVLSYALVGTVVAITLVWFAPQLLDRDYAENNAEPRSYADAVALAAPSVVNIYTATLSRDPRNAISDDPALDEFFRDGPLLNDPRLNTSLGSGVILSDNGHILTNYHVVTEAEQIQVLLADGRDAPATLVGTDPESDLAVLKIEMANLPHASLSSSTEQRVGDVVFAIGNPFGVGQTVTQGIISATGRSQLGLTTFENFIQTDAAINPGNSGGALVNASGEIIGINTAIFSQSGGSMGIGFAIPADLAANVLDGIIADGRVVRGWIGVQIQDVLNPTTGVLVAGVMPQGPADNAGLTANDLITHLDNQRIEDVNDLLNRVAAKKPGSNLVLSGLREDRMLEWELTIGERPTQLQ
ncbi:MAG: trypsin-like peptidase domain-containing protein [Gammaproteobacteria bacterium]|nr:trypsin-like peptidase domain-containing protein [Gammaproteobacteria bacterium]